jgi:hypothetical protein
MYRFASLANIVEAASHVNSNSSAKPLKMRYTRRDVQLVLTHYQTAKTSLSVFKRF